MKTGSLSDLLTLELSSPKIGLFDPSDAIDHWMITPSGRRRKLCYKRRIATETGTSQSAAPKEQLTQGEFLIATKMESVLVEQEPPNLSEGTPPTLSDLDACIIEQEQDSDINTDKPLESSPPEQVFAEEHHNHGECSDRDSDSDYDSGIDEDEPMEMSQQEVERNLLSFRVEYQK
ncbi:uncharacterized protein LOC132723128 [Ruditapes philippinarum]|uniref:uncharacterized protein LOC132723128 n=1 Tax=Ruditapes philippinarum TaxID=129788 RepID=UPI00295BE33E|nr:uncharacterized protein LOC132723128 [Ruditapes philippinarum]